MNARPLARFAAARRSAVAVIMAISLVPLMFLVGIAIDFTFLAQNRTQTAFAAQAAATQATRVAAATYALEVAETSTSASFNPTTAAKIAIDDANIAGNLWYKAELGALTRGSAAAPATATTYDGGTTGVVNPNVPPNFQAQVSDNATYPPIFDPLFGHTSSWSYTSTATATTQFSYAQILLMLDTSNSMLIGADQSDIATMEGNSVCPKIGYILAGDPGNYASGLTNMTTLQSWYGYQTNDGDQLRFDLPSAVPNYNNPSGGPSDQSGTCKSGYGPGTTNVSSGSTANSPINACALACHFTTQTVTDNNPPSGQLAGTFYGDTYGMARRENVNLRIDIVLSATENVIQDMENDQAVANQLSVGVYQFNSDIAPIVTGTNYGLTGGDALPEATSDLQTALNKVEAVDYKKTPSETAIPVLINKTESLNMSSSPPTAANAGNTNFALALNDLVAGNATGGSADKLTAAGAGATAASPQKFMFIVTDGMQDSDPANGGGENGTRVIGDMTNIAAETYAAAHPTQAPSTAICSTLKNTLGYKVYVLYVTYYPLASTIAYYDYLYKPDAATASDFPADSAASPQLLTEVPTESTTNNQKYDDSPTAKALQACASAPSDFYTASSSTDIQTALNGMLKSALASTIRLTN